MAQDIIIGGVSIQSLKAQRDAMQQEANAFVSKALSEAKAIVEQILEGDEDTDFMDLADTATMLLENADLVASVCGIVYFLEYYEEYGDYNPLSSKLDNADNLGNVWSKDSPFYKLHSQLGDMESKSRNWHSSTC